MYGYSRSCCFSGAGRSPQIRALSPYLPASRRPPHENKLLMRQIAPALKRGLDYLGPEIRCYGVALLHHVRVVVPDPDVLGEAPDSREFFVAWPRADQVGEVFAHGDTIHNGSKRVNTRRIDVLAIVRLWTLQATVFARHESMLASVARRPQQSGSIGRFPGTATTRTGRANSPKTRRRNTRRHSAWKPLGFFVCPGVGGRCRIRALETLRC